MEKMLRYDMMLEVDGVLRSQDVWVELDREVHPGETIRLSPWVVVSMAATATVGRTRTAHRAAIPTIRERRTGNRRTRIGCFSRTTPFFDKRNRRAC
jgi:hypothetical protein